MPALTPLSAPPRAISAAEHDTLTSSTPASFDDIPPVLRWEGDAEVALAVPSWTAWGDAAGVGANGGAVNGAAGSSAPESRRVPGRLYVTEQAVGFIPSSLPGFSLAFPALSLHALTPAGADTPAHIYCQIDEGGDGENEEEYTALSEMRIYVAPDKLAPLFEALSACSALHDSLMPSGEPSNFFGFGAEDDDDDEWDDDAEDGAFDDADEDHAAGGPGRALHTVTEDDGDEVCEEDADGDDADDAVSRFLAKVDWAGVQPDGGWVDVQPDGMAQLRTQLDEANARIADLEAQLRAARLGP